MRSRLRSSILMLTDSVRAPAVEWIQAELAPRYHQLEGREQRLIIVTAMLLPLLMLIFLLILPMQDRQAALHVSVEALKQQATEAGQLATQLIANGGSAQTAPVNLLSGVEKIARQTSVRAYMTRIRPQNTPGSKGKQLMVELKDAPYQAVIRFADALAMAKLGMESLKIQRGKSDGLVHVQAVIGGQ